MRWLLLTTLCAVVPLAGRAQSPPVTTFGIGGDSCTTWLYSTKLKATEGEVWILGFFSASNWNNPVTRDVGRQAGAIAIIGEVRKSCIENPSKSLSRATEEAYYRVMAEGR